MEIATQGAGRHTDCWHCGRTFFAKNSKKSLERFCCSGCEFVYEVLNREGLEDYYRVRDANPPACPLPVSPSSETFDFCDDQTFIEKMSSDGRRLAFFLEGMSCTACIWLLEKLPQLCPDAEYARVNMSNSTIEVVRKEGASFAAIARTLNRFGYRPHPLSGSKAALEHQKKENRRDLIRIGIAAAATGNIMILAVSLYGGAEGVLATQFRWLTALLAAPVLTYCAWPFYKNTWSALRSRHLNIDVPIVAALVAGIIISLWGLAKDADTIYFDSLSTLVFLLLSSRFWLKRIQQHHLDISHLEDYLLLGTVSRVGQTGSLERVSSLSLKKGDVIEIDWESVVPADGTVVSGHGLVQTAVLTGESAPQPVEEGDKVEAGFRNLGGAWRLVVEKPAAESRLAEILKDAENSSREKPALVLLADRVSQWFIGIVFALAFGIVLLMAPTHAQEGFSRALALIIVTCPCVFGMAIPLSMSLGIRAAARQGIVVKNANVLERLLKIRNLYFDKTGTLTQGDMRVLSMDVAPNMERHLSAALAIESNQPHPVARAILRELKKIDLPSLKATDVHLLSGGGIGGVVNGIHYSITPVSTEASKEAGGSSQIKARYILRAGEDLVATFDIGDEVRPEARRVVDWAKRNHFDVFLLSGDKSGVVEDCGAKLGLTSKNLTSAATPETKSAELKSKSETSLMVGDGANDAAALASASVGIAVRGSMDVSLRAADVYVARPDLLAIPTLFEIARQTRRAVLRNLAFSGSFNAISGVLALTGYMTPLWAAVLMPLSSLTVLASALTTGGKLEKAALNQEERE